MLIELGISQVSIARKLGISRAVVCSVIAGRDTSRRVQEAVALALGRPFEDIWGPPH